MGRPADLSSRLLAGAIPRSESGGLGGEPFCFPNVFVETCTLQLWRVVFACFFLLMAVVAGVVVGGVRKQNPRSLASIHVRPGCHKAG